MDKSYKKLIPTLLCRRRFLPKYIFKINEKIEIPNQYQKSYKKLINTLPQAFFAQINVHQILKNEKNLKIYEKTIKRSSLLCRRRFLPK